MTFTSPWQAIPQHTSCLSLEQCVEPTRKQVFKPKGRGRRFSGSRRLGKKSLSNGRTHRRENTSFTWETTPLVFTHKRLEYMMSTTHRTSQVITLLVTCFGLFMVLLD